MFKYFWYEFHLQNIEKIEIYTPSSSGLLNQCFKLESRYYKRWIHHHHYKHCNNWQIVHDIYKYDVVPVDKASNIMHTEQKSMPHLSNYLQSKKVITILI